MFTSFLPGFGLGLGLIAAIGAQNAFVLRQGLRGEHVLPVVLVCALSDALLISVGVAGFGTLGQGGWLGTALLWGGVAFLLAYGARSFRAAWQGGARLDPASGATQRLLPVVLTCLALTWLNPHVYLDTVVLLGSIAAQDRAPWIFGAGAMTASMVFFTTLGFGARALRPVFARPASWRWLDLGVGVVMWGLAARLARG